jgi:hypothetical protein
LQKALDNEIISRRAEINDIVVDYVQLDRRFRNLEPSKTPELSALQSYTLGDFFSQPGLGWEDLLKQRVVVVLGEPGSGKTWEFRERARDLNETGSLAFFVRLEQLVGGTLEDAVEIGSVEDLQRWKKKRRTNAVFFLDSVDEAKFHRALDFHTAIRRFASSVGAAVQRVVIFLSCRISEWRPATDAAELSAILQALDAPESKAPSTGATLLSRVTSAAGLVTQQITTEKKRTTILTVQLEPLDRKRVAKFATALGIAKHDEFVAAIDTHYAWEFARRPIDVIELANFWSAQRRLGTLSEMLEYTIETNLRPADRDKEGVLSPQLAREGAMTLSAATTFCREFTFEVPDSAFLSPAALDARECLPDTWTKEQVHALLTKPLFDSAAYGRIRFHHRRIAEYLTAKWIEQRVAEGYSTPELRELLFAQTVKGSVVRPAIAPVTAWLCCGAGSWHADVREWTAKSSPEIHFQFGDPSCLPLNYRQRLLDQIVSAFAGRKRVWVSSSPDSLSRLAHPELAGRISAIIQDDSVAIDLRCEMIQLAEVGTLTACLPVLLHRVADSAENLRVKYYAADAIASIGDHKTRRRLAKVARQLFEVPSELCAPLVEAIYPNVAHAEDIHDLLSKTEPVDVHGFGFPYRLKSYFERALTPQLAMGLLRALVDLLITPPWFTTPNHGASISTRFTWVVWPLEPVLKSVLKLPTLTQEETDLAAKVLILMGQVQHHSHLHLLTDGNTELNELTKRHPSVRRSFFWQLVEQLQEQQRYKPRHLRNVFGPDEILNPSQGDFEWLLLDIRERESSDDRQVALSAAFELWVEEGQRWKSRIELERAVANAPVLLSSLHAQLREVRWFRLNVCGIAGSARKLAPGGGGSVSFKP